MTRTAQDTISVDVNGTADFFVLTVPAGADADVIREAIEAENRQVGGSDEAPLFVEADGEIRQFIGNDITVTRNGVEVTELRSKAS